MRSYAMPRLSSASNSNFSSTRTREYSRPIFILFSPVLFFLGCKVERQGIVAHHFQLCAALGADNDFAADRLFHRDLCFTLGTGCLHRFSSKVVGSSKQRIGYSGDVSRK